MLFSVGGIRLESKEPIAPPTKPYSSKNRLIYILGEELGRDSFRAIYKTKNVNISKIYTDKEFYSFN